ncbi:MAG: GIY-YIG nuclease family protein [Acidiferrobacterales bacterium]
MKVPRRDSDRARRAQAWHVYIIECRDGSLYTGITNDLARRIRQHNAGRAARYTRGRGPVVMRYFELCVSRAQALRREWAVKRLSRVQKQALLRNPVGRRLCQRRRTGAA